MPACLWSLWEFTKNVKADDMGTTRASNDLSASCIILDNELSLICLTFGLKQYL